jgi:hypothetical protein
MPVYVIERAFVNQLDVSDHDVKLMVDAAVPEFSDRLSDWAAAQQ